MLRETHLLYVKVIRVHTHHLRLVKRRQRLRRNRGQTAIPNAITTTTTTATAAAAE